MKFCQLHWDDLRKAVNDKGMSHLVAQSGEDAMESMVNQIKGEDTSSDFDPLMGAWSAITSQFMQDLGMAAFDGDKCPLCEVEKSLEGRAQNWIDGSTTVQLNHARELGLIQGEQ